MTWTTASFIIRNINASLNHYKMKIIQTFLFTVLASMLFFAATPAKAQKIVDVQLKTLFADSVAIRADYKKPLKNAKNEIQVIYSSAFLFYKSFVSSQDKPSCIFTPSCSEYAVQTFQKNGLFIGWLSTFDRLSRCNAFANHTHYHFDPEKKLFYDPVH